MLRRLEAHAGQGGGTQAAPETMIVVNEAHAIMPNMGQAQSGDAVTSTAMAKRLLQLHRDKGMPLVIATQRPADLDKDLRGMVTGTRLIGKLEGTDKDVKHLIDTVVKNNNLNKDVKEQLKKLEADHKTRMTRDIKSVEEELIREKDMKMSDLMGDYEKKERARGVRCA